MKVTLTNRRKWLIGAGAALLLTATPGFALFGIGDIVFDPTSYASLVQQLTTLQMQYNMVKNNITHFSVKQQWQTTLHALENVNVANMFGETAGMSIALNTNSPSASSTAWKAATVTMNGSAPTYLASQSLGSSRTSQLALIETSDAVSPDCLTAVGQYRSDQEHKRHGEQLASLFAVRCLRFDQQRGSATQSPECGRGAEDRRDAVARHFAGLPRFADDGCQYGAPQRPRRRSQHRRLRPAAAFRQRHQRRERRQHLG